MPRDDLKVKSGKKAFTVRDKKFGYITAYQTYKGYDLQFMKYPQSIGGESHVNIFKANTTKIIKKVSTVSEAKRWINGEVAKVKAKTNIIKNKGIRTRKKR